jgi:hypothetical protein
MPRRRLSVVLAAGALAVLALAGCRVEPGNAAFVGDTTVSRADLDRIADQYKKDGGKLEPADESRLRAEIAKDEVFVAVASRYADEQHYAKPQTDEASLAQQSGLPESDPFLRIFAQADAYRKLLLSKAAPTAPSDADLHEIYQGLVKQGLNAPYDRLAPEIQQLAGIGQAITVRDELTKAMARYGVRLNPRYDGRYPLLAVNGQNGSVDIVVLSLSAGPAKPAVRDVS